MRLESEISLTNNYRSRINKKLFVRSFVKYSLLFSGIFTIAIITAGLFSNDYRQVVAAAAAISILAFLVLIKCYKSRRIAALDRQLLWLLEYVSTSMSTGSTFEKSLSSAAEDLDEQGSEKFRELRQALSMLIGCLNVHLDLDRSLATFLKYFNCKTAQQILGNISSLRISGGKIERYIQDSTNMLREQLELTRSIEAEQSGKSTETFIMTCTPYCMALILKFTGDFEHQLYTTEWGSLAMLAVYVLSCISLLIALLVNNASFTDYKYVSNGKAARLLLSGSISNRIPAPAAKKTNTRHFLSSPVRKLAILYQNYLPDRLWLPASKQLNCDMAALNIGSKSSPNNYFAAKLSLVSIFLIVVSVLMLLNLHASLLILLLPLIIIYQEIYLMRRSAKRRSQENMLYPKWLNLLSILLSSGLTLQRSLAICSQNNNTDEAGRKKGIDYFNLEMENLQLKLKNGISSAVILSELAANCSVFQIRHVLDLLIRYDRDGSGELLEIIALGASSSWQLYRNELRKSLLSKNLLYLIPSSLSLLAVIATALVPAAAMFIN